MLTTSTLEYHQRVAGVKTKVDTVNTFSYAWAVPPKLRRKRKGAYHHGDLEGALVEAALRTIRDDGVQALTLRGVGAQLGVSRTALYRHFEDKASLLARVALEGFRTLHIALQDALNNAPADEPLEAMGVAYVDFALANQSHYQTMFGGFLEDWNRYPDLVAEAEATFRMLVDAIQDGQQRSRVIAGDPVELAEITWSLVHGIAALGAAKQLGRTGTAVKHLAVLGAQVLREGLRPRSRGEDS